MAEVFSQTNLILPWNSRKQQHLHGISRVPRTCNNNYGVSCSLKRFPSLKLKYQVPRTSPCSSSLSASQFLGKKIGIHVNKFMPRRRNSLLRISTGAQMTLRFGHPQNWWEKGLQPNMKEVTSAQDLVDSLLNAGDRLVIVDFFSPGCGGCKALHPKICQFAEMNPDVLFLQVNHEKHKSMCYSLNVHVLPFFRLYRGAHGRVCSFSCTNATIKKFKDALAKHIPDRCSLGPTKGLEEKELLALAANKELNFTYTPEPVEPVHAPEGASEAAKPSPSSGHIPLQSFTVKPSEESNDKTIINAGR